MPNCITTTILSPRYGYHCTTPKKLQKYLVSKRIIAPVRFWPNIQTAKRWAKRVNRTIILEVLLDKVSYPLPDHKPALFSPYDITNFKVLEN